MHSDYRNPVMRELRDQQVRFAPRNKRYEQVLRAEKLLSEIQPQRSYPYEYICYRITDFRPDAAPEVQIPGEDLVHDVCLFIEDVSDAADIRREEVPEQVYTVEELAKMFNVSTKTISRWRGQGLPSRRLIIDGRKRVGFLHSHVERYVARNQERVTRGKRFSQLSDEERNEIIDRARRMAQAGGCPAEVTRRIAQRMGRSVETIRYTLRQFDEKNPKTAIFPNSSGPLTPDAKQKIYQQYRRGTSAEALAKQYCRTRSSIHRVINEMRARRILELPLDYMHNDEFEKRNAEKVILGPMPESETPTRKQKIPSGLPPYLASLYEVPLLNREQEQHLFRQFNYQKFMAAKLREKLSPSRAKASTMDRIEKYYEDAVKTKNQIVRANLRLVVSIAKRHVGGADDFFELVSDGNMSLIRAVEKFDYARGNKFSTYASWAIMKNFARTIPNGYKHRERFRSGTEEMFVAAEDNRTDQFEQEIAQQTRETQVGRILSALDEREQRIIVSRFGLDHDHEPQTLKEVGADMGVTKERVRQIEARALSKLRAAVIDERIEVPD